jgi:uncharacterized protein (TIGR03000 family)
MRLTGLKAAVLASVVALAAAAPASAWWRGYYAGYWPYGYFPSYYIYSPWYSSYTSYPLAYGYGYYPAYYGSYPSLASYYPSTYYPTYSVYAPAYTVPGTGVTTAPATTTLQSMYPPDLSAPAAAANEAVVRVQTAPDAQLWFDGVLTAQSGPVRTFGTPPLTPGKNFAYDVKIRWLQDGQPVDRERVVTVTAGQTVDVNLTPANLLR